MVTAYHAESKVTDCHAMRGTRSSGDYIREGDVILAAAMDDDEDLYAKCRTRDDIIDSNVTEGIPSFPPVESMVTAFWPIAQRVKERRSLNNESVIDSDVTEGNRLSLLLSLRNSWRATLLKDFRLSLLFILWLRIAMS